MPTEKHATTKHLNLWLMCPTTYKEYLSGLLRQLRSMPLLTYFHISSSPYVCRSAYTTYQILQKELSKITQCFCTTVFYLCIDMYCSTDFVAPCDVNCYQALCSALPFFMRRCMRCAAPVRHGIDADAIYYLNRASVPVIGNES